MCTCTSQYSKATAGVTGGVGVGLECTVYISSFVTVSKEASFGWAKHWHYTQMYHAQLHNHPVAPRTAHICVCASSYKTTQPHLMPSHSGCGRRGWKHATLTPPGCFGRRRPSRRGRWADPSCLPPSSLQFGPPGGQSVNQKELVSHPSRHSSLGRRKYISV